MSHLVQHQSRRNHAIVAVVGEKITGGAWMIIENGDSKFTEEEKRNLVVREYTSEEIQQNKNACVKKSTKKCFPLIVLIVLCLLRYRMMSQRTKCAISQSALISEIMKNTWSFVTNTVKQETTNMFSRDYSQSFPSGNILMK